jgi:hypothetical protein
VTEFKDKHTWRKQVLPLTGDLSAGQLRVLDSIANHSNGEGRNAHPGRALIAHETGLSVKQVGRNLDALKARGFIECVQKGHRRSGLSDVYELRVPVQKGQSKKDILVLQKGPLDVPPSDPGTDPKRSVLEGNISDVPLGSDDAQGGSEPVDSVSSSTSSPEAALPLASPLHGSARWDVDLATATHETRNPPSDASASSDPQVPPTEGPTPMNHFTPSPMTDAERDEIAAEIWGEAEPSVPSPQPVGHRKQPADPFINSEVINSEVEEHFRAKYAAEDAAASAARSKSARWQLDLNDPWT